MGLTKKKRAVLLCVLLALPLCACGGPGEDDAAPPPEEAGPYTLAVRVTESQDTLDPASVTARGGETVLYHLYENLLRWEDGGDGWAVLAPGQAESYTAKTDYAGNTTYTFTLREDIFWSDGTAVTAQDFADAWRRLADPANGLPHRELLSAVSGFGETGEDGEPAPLGVSAPDGRTLTVALNGSPAWFLEEVCAGAYTMPLPSGGGSNDRGKITNGAYTAVSVSAGEVTLERSGTYYDADPRGPEVIRFQTMSAGDYAALQAGEAALVVDLPGESLRALADGGLWTPEPVTETWGVLLNTRKAPFDNAGVRLAFHLAVDRQAAADAAGDPALRPAAGVVPYGVSDYGQRPAPEEEPADEPVPDPNAAIEPEEEPASVCWDFRAHAATVVTAERAYDYESDCRYAQALMAQAGYPGGAGFPETEYIYVKSAQAQAVAQALQSQWKDQLGVSVVLRSVSREEYEAALSPAAPAGDGGEAAQEADAAPAFQLAAQAFVPAYSDAEVLLGRWHSGSGDNVSGYASMAFDILLDAARAAVSPAARDAYLHDAEAILMEDSPVVPVLCRGGSYALANGLAGLYRAPDGVYFLYAVHPETA